MKKSLKLSVAVALALSSTAVYATNGVNLIGNTAKSRAMGGVGIGMPFGADNGLSNPALISSVEATEVSFGGTLFMPSVSTDGGIPSNAPLPPTFTGGMTDSEADTFIVPEVGFAMKATDNFYWGIGMWGASGLGVDYRNATNPGTANLVTNYQILQLIVPLTYKTGGLSLSVAPVVNYGALDTQWTMYNPNTLAVMGTQSAGVSQDIALGANLGAAYQTGALTLGAVYKSSIKMEYEDQPALNADEVLEPMFGITGATNWRLDVPAEYGIGASYVIGGKHTIAADVKNIAYGDTKGWEDFGWDNQTVIALGYQFDAGNYQLRVGYNYGKAPIENLGVTDPATAQANASRNFFNAVGFPATVEQHITLGGSYQFTKQLGLDLAFTYAPEKSVTYNSFSPTTPTPTPIEINTDHSQTALTAGLTFKF
jgi:long-chain fatty acid transport protein